ncbi:MAG TPA: ORF6N domain-containing protein [Nanoarchaeota archaeon]|nr:ORF6N domain-containing protein [Nanoarchaeota archaeon]
MTNNLVLSIDKIKSKIHTIRGMQVMLDADLAELYNVETRRLNEQVKRNIARFPQEFMFQLTESEFNSLMSQFATSNKEKRTKIEFSDLKSQIVTSRRGGRRKLPYAFTEQGVAMLSGILNSDIAVKISIQIINAFVAMRRFISANAQVFQRLDVVEKKQIEHDKKFEEIFDAIQSKDIKPEKGIFFDGQIFDAYKFISDVIRTANKSIILIDNYIDDSVLTLFGKRNANVQVTIFTKDISRQLALDLDKYNSQYPPVEIKEFKQSHDRFLIVDDKKVYHIGASLKDLGKKWFAFSKFDTEAFKLLDNLKSQIATSSRY